MFQVIRACQEEQVEDLKKEVRRKLMAAAASPSQLLNFIDAVQRLGVAYRFEGEIEEALQQIYDSTFHNADDMDGDLYNIALRFRLLRQQGYNISCGKSMGINYHCVDIHGNHKIGLKKKNTGMQKRKYVLFLLSDIYQHG